MLRARNLDCLTPFALACGWRVDDKEAESQAPWNRAGPVRKEDVMKTGVATLARTQPSARENTSISELLLVAQAKSGHSGAFGELYERHRLKIYRCAIRILRNRQDAEDAVQRAFQRAFTNLPRFREDSSFSTWVTRIGINEALMLLRRRLATIPLSESYNNDLEGGSVLDVADSRATPEQTHARNELRSVVLQAVSDLRRSLRAVVLLEFQGLTKVEIAGRLGLTVSAVKARIHQARRHLRKHLEKKRRVGCVDFLM